MPGSFRTMVAAGGVDEPERVADAAARGELRIPIAQTVALPDAIAALADLEHGRGSQGGKLIVTTR